MCAAMVFKSGVLLAVSLLIRAEIPAKTNAVAIAQNQPVAQSSTESRRPRLTRAFVVDDRLSALRREPDAQSQIINRLRLGRAVYIVDSRRVERDGTAYYRVAVTRRTRGWLHEAAIVVPGRNGDDARIMKLIESSSEEIDRITLCQILVASFSRSPLVPRALLRLGQESERAAEGLSQRARRRLSGIDAASASASLHDFYLNDTGLDRFSRLRVVFNFNDSTTEYVYDGKAYREVIKRFPNTEEARIASQRLEAAQQKLARKK